MAASLQGCPPGDPDRQWALTLLSKPFIIEADGDGYAIAGAEGTLRFGAHSEP